MAKLDFREILERIKANIPKQYRKDPEFRMNIVLSQLGDMAHFMTHDPEINPPARAYKANRHEEDSFGHAFINIIMLAQMRGIDIESAIELALDNLEDLDWAKKTAKNGKGKSLRGAIAHSGSVTAKAFVDVRGERLDDLRGEILVIHHARPNLVKYMDKIKGIVTDQGGRFSHAAILAREHNIPCIVATENATKLIKNGQKIRMEAKTQGLEGVVFLNV